MKRLFAPVRKSAVLMALSVPLMVFAGTHVASACLDSFIYTDNAGVRKRCVLAYPMDADTCIYRCTATALR